jgi:hypothetical protein
MDNASPAGIRANTIVLAFTLVAGTVVFLRLFTRLVLTRGAGFEDVCIGFAMVYRPLKPLILIADQQSLRQSALPW